MDEGPHRVTDSNQTPNAAKMLRGSETVGAKLHCREGNSPDRRLRSLSGRKVYKDVRWTQTTRMLA